MKKYGIDFRRKSGDDLETGYVKANNINDIHNVWAEKYNGVYPALSDCYEFRIIEVHPDYRSQAEVNFSNAANVMQANYDNLRLQNSRLIKQAVKMAQLLKLIANDEANEYSIQADELLKFFETEIGF